MNLSAAEKYRRMLRAYETFRVACTDTAKQEIANTEAMDIAEDFFTVCYHLKDYLIKDSWLDLEKAEIENYVTSSRGLSFAADFCNTIKHGDWSKAPRSGKQLNEVRRHLSMNFTGTRWINSSRLEIILDGKSEDGLTIATACVDDWNSFFEVSRNYFPRAMKMAPLLSNKTRSNLRANNDWPRTS